MVPVPLNWYRYPLRVFAQKMRDFAFFTHFSSTNLLQFVPYQKFAMESTQNNSKCGLESIKSIFLKLGLFTQIQIKKNEIRVLIYYLEPLQISSCMLLGLLGARNGKQIQPKLNLLPNPSFSPFFSSFLPQKRDLLK